MIKHRTEFQLAARRNRRRLKQAHRRSGGGLSLKQWARQQAHQAPSAERRALCTDWLQRKGLL